MRETEGGKEGSREGGREGGRWGKVEKGVRKEGRVLALKWQRLLTQKCLGDQAHLVRGLHTYRRNNPVSVTSDMETITEIGGVAVANGSVRPFEQEQPMQ